jgi:hypothetical protein
MRFFSLLGLSIFFLIILTSASLLHLVLAAGKLGPADVATQVTVLSAANPIIVAAPGSQINIQTNFDVKSSLTDKASLKLVLTNSHGDEVASADNSLDNTWTVLPTVSWMGPISIITSMTLPKLHDGDYSVRVSLNELTGPLRLTPGPKVTEDTHFRYAIGTVRISSSATSPALLSTPTLDLTGYHLTFDESFRYLSVSDSSRNDGARWYARNEECCMSTTDGAGTAMVGVSSSQNPFSLVPGAGLNIRLRKVSNSWTSGVLTTVDSAGRGFSQQFGYFEMKAKFPAGEDTWPAFWLLSTAAKSRGAPAGEIDIVEYVANPGFKDYIATTIHDWSNKTAPAASHHRVQLPTDGFHTYGMMWGPDTTTFYFDGSVTMRCPTPPIMKQPYYMIVDLGIGSGWPTEKTPSVNDMQIQYVRAYAKDSNN